MTTTLNCGQCHLRSIGMGTTKYSPNSSQHSATTRKSKRTNQSKETSKRTVDFVVIEYKVHLILKLKLKMKGAYTYHTQFTLYSMDQSISENLH